MDLGLRGRRALVTASSAGLGAAIAHRLAAEGCVVLVHGRNRERAETVASELRGAGGAADVTVGDLTDVQQTAAVGAAAVAFGATILVNNAGPVEQHDWTADDDAWVASWSSNVLSAVRLTRALTPMMRDAGWGRVINLGSRTATAPVANLVDYGAAKAAVVNMTTSLAKHLAGTGVTANAVSPGVVVTDGMREMFLADDPAGRPWPELESELATTYAPNPAGRLGVPDDVAAAVAFLASPLAGYINGIDLRVDGGLVGIA